jgi:acylphosphatase
MGGLTKHYLISGRVQGVGFRAYTQRIGEALNLIGWVRNLRDGRVEALVQGPEAALNEFEKQLRQGPPRSSVLEVVVTARTMEEKNVTLFEVRKDGEFPCYSGS